LLLDILFLLSLDLRL